MARDGGPLARLSGGLAHVLVGPWPLYPRAIAALIAYGMLIRAIVRALSQGIEGKPWVQLLLPNLVTVAVVAAVAWGGAVALCRICSSSGRPRGQGRYLVAILLETLLITLALVAMVRFLLRDGHTPVQPGVVPVAAFSAIMILVTVAFANGVTGFVLERFRREEDLLRAERTMQLAAEERVRAETARYLHDDVQTALLRASLRLVPLVASIEDAEARDALRAAITEIDAVRDDGVRNVGRRLAPPLGSTGLIVALHELAGSYAGVMAVDVEFDDDAAARFRIVEEDDRIALALYRLVEQALQNALKHGGAGWAHVAIEMPAEHHVALTVEADGAAPSSTRVAGNGTAIINAWLGDVGGTWSLDAGEAGGSRFRAAIALGD
jgi:signal transduction histidine kinase